MSNLFPQALLEGSLSVPASMSELGREISPPAPKMRGSCLQNPARKSCPGRCRPYKVENIRKLRKF